VRIIAAQLWLAGVMQLAEAAMCLTAGSCYWPREAVSTPMTMKKTTLYG